MPDDLDPTLTFTRKLDRIERVLTRLDQRVDGLDRRVDGIPDQVWLRMSSSYGERLEAIMERIRDLEERR